MISPGTDPSRETRRYSPFWAICLVFLPLIFLQVAYLVEDFKQYKDLIKQGEQIENARTQLKDPLARAQTVSQVTDAVGRELLALSANSVEASNIITEFKIQLNRPSPSK